MASIFTAIGDFVHGIYQLFLSLFQTVYHVFETIITMILNFFTGILTLIGDTFQGVFGVVGGVGNFVISKFTRSRSTSSSLILL